ncbi:MAG: ATP-binding protein [Magnetococcales bacterium]|nr:ATP-binding protein [Magnetococcales bacterium]
MTQIRPKERDAILQSLRAGVVPRQGLHHIAVGRDKEIQAMIQDIDRIADNGSAIRFIIGEYGSGKTFFLYLVRSIALEKGLVTASADLTPDRRIQGSGGQARNLYAELMRNLSTRTKRDGGALPSIVERFISTALNKAKDNGAKVDTIIHAKLSHLSELVGGYDFANVIEAYWQGHDTGNETLKTDAIRWLRGEFSTQTDARKALGVRTIISDANVYDHLKLMARFIHLSGYKGLMIGLDEMVNLYKLANSQARNGNYEQILRILNDCLQGVAEGLGFVFGGTPEFLTDPRRGLYSYPALQTRLAENSFAVSTGLTDFTGPVIRLANLSQEEMFALLLNIRHVFAAGDQNRYLVPDEALNSFMAHCSQRIGEAYFRTPRNTIRAFIDFLSVQEQHPEMFWKSLIRDITLPNESNPDLAPLPNESGELPGDSGSDLVNFRL